MYACLCSELLKSTIQSWIVNTWPSEEQGFQTHDEWLLEAGDIPESIQCLYGLSFRIKQLTEMTWPPMRITTITTDKSTIFQGDKIIRNGSLTHNDVINLKIRALNNPDAQIHLGLKGWIVDGRLIDDADYDELVQMLAPLISVSNICFPLCFWVGLINSSPSTAERAYFRDHITSDPSKLLKDTKDRDEYDPDKLLITTIYSGRAEWFTDKVVSITSTQHISLCNALHRWMSTIDSAMSITHSKNPAGCIVYHRERYRAALTWLSDTENLLPLGLQPNELGMNSSYCTAVDHIIACMKGSYTRKLMQYLSKCFPVMRPQHRAQLRSILSNMSPPRISNEFLDQMNGILENCLYHQYDFVLPGLRQWFMEESAPTSWENSISTTHLYTQLRRFRRFAEQLNNIRRSIRQRTYYFHFRTWQLHVLSGAFELSSSTLQRRFSCPDRQRRDDYRGSLVMCALRPLRTALLAKIETLRILYSCSTALHQHLLHQSKHIGNTQHLDCKHCKPHPKVTCSCATAESILLTHNVYNYLRSQVNINKFFSGLATVSMEDHLTCIIIPPSDLGSRLSGTPVSGYFERTHRHSHLEYNLNSERIAKQLIDDITENIVDIRKQENVLDQDVAFRLKRLTSHCHDSNWLSNIDRNYTLAAFNVYAAMHNIQNLTDIKQTIFDDANHAHPPFGSHARQEIMLRNSGAILCEVVSNLIPTVNDTLERVPQSESEPVFVTFNDFKRASIDALQGEFTKMIHNIIDYARTDVERSSLLEFTTTVTRYYSDGSGLDLSQMVNNSLYAQSLRSMAVGICRGFVSETLSGSLMLISAGIQDLECTLFRNKHNAIRGRHNLVRICHTDDGLEDLYRNSYQPDPEAISCTTTEQVSRPTIPSPTTGGPLETSTRSTQNIIEDFIKTRIPQMRREQDQTNSQTPELERKDPHHEQATNADANLTQGPLERHELRPISERLDRAQQVLQIVLPSLAEDNAHNDKAFLHNEERIIRCVENKRRAVATAKAAKIKAKEKTSASNHAAKQAATATTNAERKEKKDKKKPTKREAAEAAATPAKQGVKSSKWTVNRNQDKRVIPDAATTFTIRSTNNTAGSVDSSWLDPAPMGTVHCAWEMFTTPEDSPTKKEAGHISPNPDIEGTRQQYRGAPIDVKRDIRDHPYNETEVQPDNDGPSNRISMAAYCGSDGCSEAARESRESERADEIRAEMLGTGTLTSRERYEVVNTTSAAMGAVAVQQHVSYTNIKCTTLGCQCDARCGEPTRTCHISCNNENPCNDTDVHTLRSFSETETRCTRSDCPCERRGSFAHCCRHCRDTGACAIAYHSPGAYAERTILETQGFVPEPQHTDEDDDEDDDQEDRQEDERRYNNTRFVDSLSRHAPTKPKRRGHRFSRSRRDAEQDSEWNSMVQLINHIRAKSREPERDFKYWFMTIWKSLEEATVNLRLNKMAKQPKLNRWAKHLCTGLQCEVEVRAGTKLSLPDSLSRRPTTQPEIMASSDFTGKINRRSAQWWSITHSAPSRMDIQTSTLSSSIVGRMIGHLATILKPQFTRINRLLSPNRFKNGQTCRLVMDARAINADIFKSRTSLLNRIEGRSLLGSIKYYHSIFDRYQRTPLLMTETISNGGTFQASQIEEEDEEDVETVLPLITEIEEEEDEDAEATMRLGESRQLSLFCLAGGNMYKEGEDEEDEVECDTLDPNPTASPIQGEHIGDTETMEEYQGISEASKEETELTRRSGFAILIKYFRKRGERAFAHMRYWVLKRGPTLWEFERI